MNINLWTASFVCFILAAVLAAASAVCRHMEKVRRTYAGKARGHVVHIITEPADGGKNRTEFHDRQYAVIEFFAQGHLVKVKSQATVYPCPYYVGQSLELCYDPGEPERYQILTDRKWEILSALSYGFSLAMAAAGGVLFLMFAGRYDF